MKIKQGVKIDVETLYPDDLEAISGFGVLVGVDQATNSGVAVLGGGVIATRRVTIQTKLPLGREIGALCEDLLDDPRPTFLAHEVPTGRFYNAIVKSANILGALSVACDSRGVGMIGYTATDIKKFATGKGNANKARMLATAREFAEFSNDDEADAFFILRRLIEDLLKNAR